MRSENVADYFLQLQELIMSPTWGQLSQNVLITDKDITDRSNSQLRKSALVLILTDMVVSAIA